MADYIHTHPYGECCDDSQVSFAAFYRVSHPPSLRQFRFTLTISGAARIADLGELTEEDMATMGLKRLEAARLRRHLRVVVGAGGYLGEELGPMAPELLVHAPENSGRWQGQQRR